MHKKTFHFQMAVKTVEDSDDGGVTISGFASTPDLDRYRDIVEPKAFASALEMYMKNPTVLRSHDADRPVGTVVNAKISEKGLHVTAKITDSKTVEEIKDGRMRAMSIGYIPLATELEHEDGTAFNFEEDSVWDPSLVRVIKTLDLVEISIVSTPANGHALFTLQKSLKQANTLAVCKAFNITDESMKKKEVETTEEEEEKLEKAPKEVEETTEETEVETPEGETTEEAEVPEGEDAGNGDGTSPAGDTEGKSKDEAEEVNTDAEPKKETEEETVEEEEDEEEEGVKAIISLSKKTSQNMKALKNIGAIKLVDEEKEDELTPEAKSVIELAEKAIGLLQKHVEELEAKLDKHADKKPLAPVMQMTGKQVEKQTETNKKRTASKGFTGLFNGNK